MIWGDYHTHTTYSHGKGSVEDNVKAALALGLKEIAVTDHGLRHRSHGVKRKALSAFFEDVRRMNETYPQIRVYAGMEANFLSPRGEIDAEEIADRLDVTVVGYHKFVKPLRFGDNFSYFFRNLVTKNAKKMLVRNTDAYLNALEKYPIDIISHPMHDCKIDLRAVGERAAALGTYLELNGKHVDMTADDLQMLAALGCKFVMDSDAHSPDRVGDVSAQIAAVEAAGLPLSSVENWERLPEFRSRKKEQ